jgi:hypothetical protein
MTDHALHGNHDPCPACALRREALGAVPIAYGEVPCNNCSSKGYLPLSDAEIVRRTVEEARRLYWPAVEARLQEALGRAP